MNPLIYQLLHPWHWLTYKQNAAGLGLVGLFFYTLYTRRMMLIAEETRRASLTPKFVLEQLPAIEKIMKERVGSDLGFAAPEVVGHSLVLKVRNIGKGPALFITSWFKPVSSQFKLRDSMIWIRSPDAGSGDQAVTHLSTGESAVVKFNGVDVNFQNWLFIVETPDLAKGKNQLQILITGFPKGEIELMMSHALGDTAGERLVRFASRVRMVTRSVGLALIGKS